jgi:hypothetical protein
MVEPGECPPPRCDEGQPDVECTPDEPPPDEMECDPSQPDVECGDSGVPPPPGIDCFETPEDPACNVD